MLDKGISADGNPKANVAINHKARWREQRAEVIEGGIGSEHAHSNAVMSKVVFKGAKAHSGRPPTILHSSGAEVDV